MNTLTLIIANLETLQHGALARHLFGRSGGTVGSEGADWQIVDRERRIHSIHCEIRWLEGSFCVIDRCNQTFLNNSPLSLGESGPVRLQEGDQLRIGTCRLQVRHDLGQLGSQPLESMFTAGQLGLGPWLESAPASALETAVAVVPIDICAAFAQELGHDPLAALNIRPPAPQCLFEEVPE